MSGSKTNRMSLDAVRAAVEAVPPGKDFVWDGKDEDDRPASAEELSAALEASRVRRGRPTAASPKLALTVRYDADIVAAFKATGRGWQTRMNAALRDWLKTHSPAQ